MLGFGRLGYEAMMMAELLYSEINLLCIVMLAAIFLGAWQVGFDASAKKTTFLCAVVSLAVANLCDLFWNLGLTGAIGFSDTAKWLIDCFYFLTFGVSALSWFWYSEMSGNGTKPKKRSVALSALPLVLLLGLLIVTRFNGCLFYFDAEGEFHRGSLYYLQHILTYGCVVIASFRQLSGKRMTGDRVERFIKWLTAAIPLVFAILQIAFQSLPILSVGASVSLLMVFTGSLESMVSVDPLTGICNRREFFRRAENAIGGLNPRHGKQLYFLFIDVDSFKQINDVFGHDNGDRVLRTVAGAIRSVCEKTGGLCGRYGGDEFAIVQTLYQTEDISVFLRMLNDCVEKRCAAEKLRCHVGLSIGVAKYHPGEESLEDLISVADAKMYEVKESGRKQPGKILPTSDPGEKNLSGWLAQNELLNRLLLEHFDGALLIDKESGTLTKVNDEIIGKLADYVKFDDTLYDAQFAAMAEALQTEPEPDILKAATSLATVTEQLEKKQLYAVEFRICKPDGTHFYQRLTYRYFDEKRALILLLCEDVSSIVRSEKDILTGGYNFNGFHNRVREWIRANPGRKYRMQRYNIDRFRDINGIYGHEAGNQFLRDISNYMKRLDTEDSFSAHLNGDHFVRFCSEDSVSPEECYDNFVQHFSTYRFHMPITLHIGVYDLCEPDCDTVTMSYKALLAMQSIKGDLSRHIGYYEKGMLKAEQRQRELLGDVERAIREGEFEVWFQPQVDYESGAVFGAEALVRWRHPEHGLLAPDTFIPLLEKSNYVSTVDAYVVERTCAFMHRMMLLFPEKKIQVSVNLSRLDVGNRTFEQALSRAVEENGIPVEDLHLEVTESAYAANDKEFMQGLETLKTAGYFIEMDDFGAGYSSLNALKDIRVDKLKLDMKFVEEDDTEGRGKIILSSIVNMTRKLGIRVIAEGVETKEQAEMLRSFGCSQMQGYYFSRPLPEREYEELLKSKKRMSACSR